MSDTALEQLSEQECLAMLKTVHFGRLAVVTGEGRPEVFPLNFLLHENTVVFATESSVILSWAPFGHIAFEADQIDPQTHEGWDVVVQGEGADITGAVDAFSAQSRAIRLDLWAPGQKAHWISIANPVFSGRRLYRPAPSPTFG
jgi:uncharacterized protein